MKFYLNMDLELFGYQNDEYGGARFRVYAPTGSLPRDQAEEVILTSELHDQLRRLEGRELNWQELINLGGRLAELLFPPQVRVLFIRNIQNLIGDQGLRIRLKMENYALADLPWEYTYLPTDDPPPAEQLDAGFLALNPLVSLVRNEAPKQARDSFTPIDQDPLRIVTLLADPGPPDYAPLDVSQEINKIRDMLNEMKNRPYIQLYPNATRKILEDIVDDEQQPHVLHFAGYSRFEGDLCVAYGAYPDRSSVVFQDAVPFSAEGLALNLKGRGIRLVVLGACAAGRHKQVNAWTCIAPALTQSASIPAVVGLQYTIDHESILAFCRRFYRSLNEGKPIDAAVTDGRQAIYNLDNRPDDRDWGVPVVYLRTADPVLFPRREQQVFADIQRSSTSAEVMRRGVAPAFSQSNNGVADVRQYENAPPPNVDQRAPRYAVSAAFDVPVAPIATLPILPRPGNGGVVIVVSLPSKGEVKIVVNDGFIDRLVSQLLQCQSMSDAGTRKLIVSQLPPDVQNAIDPSGSPKVLVTNIVQNCLRFPNGLESLIERVRYFEGPSFAMQAVDSYLAENG